MPHSRRYRVIPETGIELLAADYRAHRFVPHSHDYAVLAITESGEAAGLSTDGTQTLGPGDVLLIPPNVVHAAQSIGGDPWRYRAVYLSATRFERLRGGGADGGAGAGTATVIQQASALARHLRELHHDLESASDPVVSDALDAVLTEVEPLLERAFPQRPAARPTSGAVCLARAMIDAAPERRWSLPVLARACGVSSFHLCRAFRQQVGASPYGYALQRRVVAARERLRSDWTISEVAHELGFADQSHFTRLFLRVFGVTPGEYRAALPPGRS